MQLKKKTIKECEKYNSDRQFLKPLTCEVRCGLEVLVEGQETQGGRQAA